MATSTAQAIATVPVYDYVSASGDPTTTTTGGLKGKRVKVTLNFSQASSSSPVTSLDTGPVVVQTDGNGFWQVHLVPTDQINPSGVLYQVEIEGQRTYLINPTQAGVPGIGWQSSAIATSVPPTLGAAGQTIPGPLTITGALTVNGLATLAAGLVVSGGTGITISAAGDIAGRSFTASTGIGPYASLLADGVTPTPAGVLEGNQWQWGSGVYSVLAAGAKGDALEVTDAIMTPGSGIVTSASGKFTAAAVGKKAYVRFAGPAVLANPTVAISGADGGAGPYVDTAGHSTPVTNLPTGTYTFTYAWAIRGYGALTTAGTSAATYVQTVANHIITLTVPALPAGAEVTEIYVTVAPAGAFTGFVGLTNTTTFNYVTGNTSNVRGPLATTTAGATLQTTIASYQSATQVTLAANATLATPAGVGMMWGTDDAAARDLAVTTALAYAATGGTATVLYPPPSGVGYLHTTGTTINVPRINFSGLWAKVYYTGASDCFRIQMAPFDTNAQVGQTLGLVVNGQYAQDGATGIHAGDAMQMTFQDVTVQFFNGVGSKGWWLDNRTNWSERMCLHHCWAHLNTIGVLYDINLGNASFSHNQTHHLKISAGVGQTGLQVQNAAALTDSVIEITGNSDVCSTMIMVKDTAVFGGPSAGNLFAITCEDSGPTYNNATGLNLAAGAVLFGVGVIDLSAGQFTNTAPGAGGTNIQFLGRFDCPGIYAPTGESGTAFGTGFTSKGALKSLVNGAGGGLVLVSGNTPGSSVVAQAQVGLNGLQQWQHWIATEHSGNPALNLWRFYTSDGTQAGVYPTNALHALSMGAGHLLTGSGAAPATSTLNANITSVTFTGNDRRGTIAIVVAAGGLVRATKICTCTFALSYGATSPQCFFFNQTSGNLALVNLYKLAFSTGVSIDIASDQALVAGTYTFGYIIEG